MRKPKEDWREFWRALLGTFIVASAILYGFIVLIDPFNSIFFSPPVARAPVTTNQRFAFPALARSAKFDSAIFGTSMTRLLRPASLNAKFGARFVNLSMNSATAWEQHQIFTLFARHHRAPKVVIFGIDGTWCDLAKQKKLTFRPFPPWLYDENPWNDLLYLYNPKTLEQAGLQFAFISGMQPARRGLDGYTNFLPPPSDYNLARARRNIYGSPAPKPIVTTRPPVPADPSWRFPSHARLRAMLGALPPRTVKIFLLVPYHVYRQPHPGSRAAAQYRLCKRRFAELARGRRNVHILDFMIPSSLTRADANYWDSLHFNLAASERIAAAMRHGVTKRRGIADLFTYIPVAGVD
jgi:hypothetical protein